MKWYKQPSDEDESPFIGELLSRFGFRGYYFWHRLKKLMSKHFDVYNPGCNKFDMKWFLLNFAEIKDPRTIESYLEFLQNELKLFFWKESRHLVLYWPELERLSDEYTGKVIVDIVKNRDDEIPMPTFMHDRCRSYAEKIALQKAENAKKMIENKQNMSKSVGTNSRHDVGTSSVSSSRGVNSIKDKEDKRRKFSTPQPY